MHNDTVPVSFPAHALARWQAASTPIGIGELLGAARSLGVIVPHPDDETLGCGGLIAAAAAHGLTVTVTFLTDGGASHPESTTWPPDRLALRRQHEAACAVATLTEGNGQIVFAAAPDGRLADHPGAGDVVPLADLFVTCWHGDPHPDHVAAFAIARTVAARFSAPLLAFPLWVLTTDAPVPGGIIHRLDVSPYLDRKRRALAAHSSQLGFPEAGVPGFVLDSMLQRLFVRPDELFARVDGSKG